MPFIRLKNFPFIFSFLNVFLLLKGVYFFKYFYASIELITWFFFYSINKVIELFKFSMLNWSCIPGINSIWSWYIIFFICCWVQFASIWLSIFTPIFIRDIGLYFSFLVTSLSSSAIRVILASKSVGKCFLLFYLLKEFMKD